MESINLLTKESPATIEKHNFDGDESVELSVVMPCLNESDTLAVCIEKAWRAISENNISGEIIVADNGSTDASERRCELLR